MSTVEEQNYEASRAAFDTWWSSTGVVETGADHYAEARLAFHAAFESRKTFGDWAREIHDWSTGNGWWSRPTDNIAGKLLLVHSEVSEAAEELRTAGPCPHGAPDVDFDDLRRVEYQHPVESDIRLDFNEDSKGRLLKPVGFRSELADTLIRILDIYARIGADPDSDVAQKMAYNRTRSHRHGGKGL